MAMQLRVTCGCRCSPMQFREYAAISRRHNAAPSTLHATIPICLDFVSIRHLYSTIRAAAATIAQGCPTALPFLHGTLTVNFSNTGETSGMAHVRRQAPGCEANRNRIDRFGADDSPIHAARINPGTQPNAKSGGRNRRKRLGWKPYGGWPNASSAVRCRKQIEHG